MQTSRSDEQDVIPLRNVMVQHDKKRAIPGLPLTTRPNKDGVQSSQAQLSERHRGKTCQTLESERKKARITPTMPAMDESRKHFNLVSNSIDDETRDTLGMSFNLTGIAGKITNPDEMLIVTN